MDYLVIFRCARPRTLLIAAGITVFVALSPTRVAGQDGGRDQERRATPPPPALQTYREHHTWGVFLGTGATEAERRSLEQQIQRGEWINPFTRKPFDDVKVFAFGRENPAVEATRVLSDHLQIPALSPWKPLEGQHFDFVICHSNGCTNALGAQAEGVMRAEQVLAIGTDWTSKSFKPGELRGAEVTFFTMPGDAVHRLPAPNWTQVSEHTPGLAIEIPFGRPSDIPRGLRDLVTTGRADPDRYPVVRLDRPTGQGPTITRPFRPHSMIQSYSPALEAWMQQGGAQQRELSEKIQQAERRSVRDDTKPGVLPPGGGGPGGGPGAGSAGGSSPFGSVPGASPSTPATGKPGGVSAEIAIDDKDIVSRRGRAPRQP